MITWMRRTLPPEWTILACVLLYIFTAFTGPLVWLLVLGEPVEFPFHAPQGAFVLGFGMFLYGVFRAVGFHPVFRSGYRNWLRTTPWNASLPLPLGPVRLVAQDIIVVVVTIALSQLYQGIPLMMAPVAFMFGYLLLLALGLMIVGQPVHAAAIMFGLGAIPIVGNSVVPLLAVLALVYVVAAHGIARSLESFENWDFDQIGKYPLLLNNERLSRNHELGWPFRALAPLTGDFVVSRNWAAVLSLLAGWCFLAAIIWVAHSQSQRVTVFHKHESIIVIFYAALLATMSAVFRLIAFVGEHMPPISLWARLRTMRWIIPGYDVVFVAPLLILLLNAIAITIVHWHPWTVIIAAPLLVAGSLFLALICPPTYANWHLTGQHRHSPGRLTNSQRSTAVSRS